MINDNLLCIKIYERRDNQNLSECRYALLSADNQLVKLVSRGVIALYEGKTVVVTSERRHV